MGLGSGTGSSAHTLMLRSSRGNARTVHAIRHGQTPDCSPHNSRQKPKMSSRPCLRQWEPGACNRNMTRSERHAWNINFLDCPHLHSNKKVHSHGLLWSPLMFLSLYLRSGGGRESNSCGKASFGNDSPNGAYLYQQYFNPKRWGGGLQHSVKKTFSKIRSLQLGPRYFSPLLFFPFSSF